MSLLSGVKANDEINLYKYSTNYQVIPLIVPLIYTSLCRCISCNARSNAIREKILLFSRANHQVSLFSLTSLLVIKTNLQSALNPFKKLVILAFLKVFCLLHYFLSLDARADISSTL